jgi:hypothetical protein
VTKTVPEFAPSDTVNTPDAEPVVRTANRAVPGPLIDSACTVTPDTPDTLNVVVTGTQPAPASVNVSPWAFEEWAWILDGRTRIVDTEGPPQ